MTAISSGVAKYEAKQQPDRSTRPLAPSEKKVPLRGQWRGKCRVVKERKLGGDRSFKASQEATTSITDFIAQPVHI